MQIATTTQNEVQETIETVIALVNGLGDEQSDVRQTLVSAGFTGATEASGSSISRLESRLHDLAPLMTGVSELTVAEASREVNERLSTLPIAPHVVAHDGIGPHLHWTVPATRFDDQVIADALMAMAQELCDHGTERFGRCGASDCDDLFYDATRNHSKRFCADPRCASRTHTAHHRARKKRQPE